MERLRITIDFTGKKEEEVKLYYGLQKHSNPAAYIKDVLLGLVPIPGQYAQSENKENATANTEYEEDLMDI